MSFVSPNKVLKDKNLYYMHHYLKDLLGNKYQMTVDNLEESFKDFSFTNKKKLEDEFHQSNNYQTTVQGLKIRGVFDTYREAEIRSKVLQRLDPGFDVFVGQVGYWLPWDPHVNDVENQEYLEGDLNNLVKEYKKNESKKDLYYSERVKSRKETILEENKKKEEENKKREEEEKLTTVAENGNKEEVENEEENKAEKSSLEDELKQMNDSESHAERKKQFENQEAEKVI